MWIDDLPKGASWDVLWHDYILCGRCNGIRTTKSNCSVCGTPMPSLSEQRETLVISGKEIEVSNHCFAGAEGRYEDYLYLRLMQREWNRPVLGDGQNDLQINDESSARASVVLLYWTYFESRIERLFRSFFSGQHQGLVDNALQRNLGIGSRLGQFYRAIFESTYERDLIEAGFKDIADHLKLVQVQRNKFSHGDPGAITDDLVEAIVNMLKLEHESWIAVFNRRVAKNPSVR